MVASKHPYWNRTAATDHFMLSCHDWGPHASRANPQSPGNKNQRAKRDTFRGASMASLLLSDSTSLKPLTSAALLRSRPRFPADKHRSIVFSGSRPLGISTVSSPRALLRDWTLRVRSSARPAVVEEVREKDIRVGREEFDTGMPPQFGLAEIRAAIPKQCWVKNPWRSMSYVVRDVAVVIGLGAAAAYINNWVVWPLYWAAQGTMFWALFVLGHDCGHSSFIHSCPLSWLENKSQNSSSKPWSCGKG